MSKIKITLGEGRGGGLMVSVLALYSDHPSSIPAAYLESLFPRPSHGVMERVLAFTASGPGLNPA